MKLTTRNLVTLAVFGALWGLSEISLGSVLKALDLPFSGTILATIGLVILAAAYVDILYVFNRWTRTVPPIIKSQG